MEKKYELTNETLKLSSGQILHRIRALKELGNFGNIKPGELGGFIEKEENLSHEGNCWVYHDSCIYGNAKVSGNAKVFYNVKIFENAQVYGDAQVYGFAQIYGNSKVYDKAYIDGKILIGDNACIYNNGLVSESARVLDNARVFENAHVCGFSTIRGSAKIYGDCHISGHSDICDAAMVYGNAIMRGYMRADKHMKIYRSNQTISIGPIGNNIDILDFICLKNDINVQFGNVFNGTLNKFEKLLKSKNLEIYNIPASKYLDVVDFVRKYFGDLPATLEV